MKYKYRFESYILFDCVGLEKHLKSMAAKGWQLESIGKVFWKYRKEESADLAYSVTYLPQASAYDPEITDEGEELKDYCAAAGWKKVADLLQLQIFVNEQPNAIPIETDESVRLDVIRQSMKKNFLLSHGLLGIVMLMNLMLRIGHVKDYPLQYLPDDSWFNSVILFGFSALIMALDVVYFLYWSWKAGKSVEKDNTLPEAKLYHWIARFSWIILLILVVRMLSDTGYGLFMIVYLALMIPLIMVVWGTNRRLRKRNASKGKNFALTLLVDVVLVLALTGFMVRFGLSMNIGREDPYETLQLNNYTWRIYHNKLPLYIEDFIDTDYEHYSYQNSTHESIFLKSEDCQQSAPPDGESHPEMRYTVYTVKMDFLYDDVIQWIEDAEFRHYTEEGRAMSDFIPQDATVWGADEVYQLKIGDEVGIMMEDKYIICVGNKVIEFRPYFELTDDMKTIIVEKLR